MSAAVGAVPGRTTLPSLCGGPQQSPALLPAAAFLVLQRGTGNCYHMPLPINQLVNHPSSSQQRGQKLVMVVIHHFQPESSIQRAVFPILNPNPVAFILPHLAAESKLGGSAVMLHQLAHCVCCRSCSLQQDTMTCSVTTMGAVTLHCVQKEGAMQACLSHVMSF